MNRHKVSLTSDAAAELRICIDRMALLTDRLTDDEAQPLDAQQLSGLHFWLSELVFEAQNRATRLDEAMSCAFKGAGND